MTGDLPLSLPISIQIWVRTQKMIGKGKKSLFSFVISYYITNFVAGF